MKFKFNKVKVSIDHITLTSDDTSFIVFNPKVISNYKFIGQRNIRKMHKNTYKTYLEFSHLKTFNKMFVFTDRGNVLGERDDNEYNYFLPNATIKFYSSWDNPLTFQEVAGVVNEVVKEYNIAFNLAEFHVAIDLFSGPDDNYLEALKGVTKSNRIYDPDEDPDKPGTYYYQSNDNKKYPFRLLTYDKKKDLLDKNKNRIISEISLNELIEVCIIRIEFRVYNTVMGIVPSLESLADYCFDGLFETRVQFFEPDLLKLEKQGLDPDTCKNMRLKELKQYLKENGIVNNFFYYTKKDENLINLVEQALKYFRWCNCPEEYPIIQPQLILKPRKIKFV